MLRGDHRRQLAHDEPGDVLQVATALHQAGDAGEVALEPVLFLVGESGLAQVGDHRVDVVLELQDLAGRVHVDLEVEIAPGHRGGDLRDGPDLPGQIARHLVHRLREVAPRAVHVAHSSLTPQLTLGTHLAGHPGHLVGERGELVDHRVDGRLQLEDLAARVDVDLLGEVALRDGRRHHRDVADLARQVGRHRVHGLGEVLPRPADARDAGLAAQDAVGADLAGHARDLVREGRQRRHHRVDGVGQLRHLATRLDGDLLREVTVGDRAGDLRDVADLTGQVVGHQVDVVGEVLPDAGDVPHPRLTAQLALRTHLAGHPGHLLREVRQLVHHRVHRGDQLEDLALGVDGDLLGQVALGDRRRHLGNVAHLRRQVVGHEVDRLREVLPGPRDALHLRLAAQDALGAHLAGHPGHLLRERGQLVHHRVEGVLQLQDLAPGIHVDLLRQITTSHRRRDLRDVADLGGQVLRHAVHRVRQVAPDASDARHLRLTAQPAVRAHLTGHAGHLLGKGGELVDHRVDGVLQLQDLAPGVHVDLLRQVTARHRRGHLGDLPHLGGEVAGHEVDGVGELLPGAADAVHPGLTAQPALRTHVPRHPRHLVGERGQLVHHGVHGVLQLQHLAGHVDRDLLRQVAVRHRRGHLRDVADLPREVAESGVDGVRQVLPRTRRARHLCLTAEFALDTDLPCHARDFGTEGLQLIHHPVDGVLQLQHLAGHIDGDLLAQVAVGDGRRHLRDVPHLAGEVAERRIDGVRQVLPRTRRTRHLRLTAEQALRAHLVGHTRHLVGEGAQRLRHLIDRLGQLRDLAARAHRDLLRQVAVRHRRGDLRDPAHLGRQVAGHEVHGVGEVLPDARDPRHLGLTAQLALGAHLTGHTGDLGGEGRELVHHGVHGVLQLEHLPGHVHRDLPGQIALRDGRRHERDVTHLSGQPGRHRVDGIREVLPGPGHPAHPGLPAELALGTDLARHPRHLVGERRQLVHQPVDRAAHLQELAPQRVRGPVRALRAQIHPLLEVALRDRREHPAHLGHGPHQIVDQRVRRVDRGGPGPLAGTEREPFREFSLTTDHPPHPGQLTGELQIAVRDLVEDRGDLGHHPVAGHREPLAEVAVPHRLQGRQQAVQGRGVHLRRPIGSGPSALRARAHAPRRRARLHRVPPAGSIILVGLPLRAVPVFHRGPARP